MDFGDLIPLLIIIGIPLLRRGLGRGNKEKRRTTRPANRTKRTEYKESQSPVYYENYDTKKNQNDYLNEKELVGKEKEDYSIKKQDKWQREIVVEDLKAEKEDNLLNTDDNILDGMFDERSIIRGFIFSEIIGPPKSRNN